LYTDGILSLGEFFILADDLRSPEPNPSADDVFKQLRDMMIVRENSRRHTNYILKPQSELDLTLFANHDRVTPKYYCLPYDFPIPVCSGRYHDPILSSVLNDKYCSISSGSENFRFRTRYEYEQKLFDNEDSMY